MNPGLLSACSDQFKTGLLEFYYPSVSPWNYNYIPGLYNFLLWNQNWHQEL